MRLWCAAACLVALPAFADGQSLGQAARKERERREKTREGAGSPRTLTEEDLATTKGTLANDPKAQPATTAAPRTTGTTSGSGLAYPPIPAGPSAETQEEYWRRRVAQAQARIEQARRRNDALQLMIRFGQTGSYDANGRRVIYSIHQMKAMADAAAAELAAAQAGLEGVLEDGRRAGAQPGWLR
jgi:hypothetical protein